MAVVSWPQSWVSCCFVDFQGEPSLYQLENIGCINRKLPDMLMIDSWTQLKRLKFCFQWRKCNLSGFIHHASTSHQTPLHYLINPPHFHQQHRAEVCLSSTSRTGFIHMLQFWVQTSVIVFLSFLSTVVWMIHSENPAASHPFSLNDLFKSQKSNTDDGETKFKHSTFN